ncbi:MAG TPA: DUF3618 domain-containing protein [Steroidobacteraceae bacterium]|jgi:hypothetical protein|nr:DUF3618 domain-containing protein [Steroidobacteraceae bacterium]
MNATSERPDASRDAEQLERSAEQIRADLDRTLDALERRLSPSQLLDRSLTYLREHSGELTRAVGETVRRNPVPIMLAVAGIGWLVTSTLRSRSDSDDRLHDRIQRAADVTREHTRRTQDQVVSAIQRRPILLGSLAVALGALIGALIPASEYEDRIVGQVRDRAVQRAKQMGERQYQNLRSRLETHRDLEVSGRAH